MPVQAPFCDNPNCIFNGVETANVPVASDQIYQMQVDIFNVRRTINRHKFKVSDFRNEIPFHKELWVCDACASAINIGRGLK